MTDAAGPDRTVLRLERTFAAPARAVFDAWTSVEALRRWLHAGHDWETPRAEVDLRVGGAIRVTMRDPEGREHGGAGEFTEIRPPDRLAYTWSWDDEGPPRSTLVEVDLAERDGTTTVVLTHRGLAGEASTDSHREGWAICLDNLGRLIDRPRVVSAEEWRVARDELLTKEKAATRARDALAAERRRMPMVRVEKRYAFEGPEGPTDLLGLFDGRRQLLLYRFFFDPGMEGFPDVGCPGCSMFTDQVGHLAHFHARDTSFALASAAPVADIERLRARMGWEIPWYSTTDGFSADFDVPEAFGLNVFLREGDRVFRTYFTTGRGVEALGSVWSFLDLTPLGRQETWEDSPAGWPQSEPYAWWRRHDEYREAS